jgi:hypothetical protein
VNLTLAGFAWFIAWSVAAVVLAVRSARHRSPGRTGTGLGVLVRGSLARREEFSERGWQYRTWAGACQAIGFAGFVAALMLGS